MKFVFTPRWELRHCADKTRISDMDISRMQKGKRWLSRRRRKRGLLMP
jgi:hypothetical protein